MSASCKCPERKRHLLVRDWRVTQRQCNHSAFNGGRRTDSAYSEITCLRCGARWRTTAAYVGQLRDQD